MLSDQLSPFWIVSKRAVFLSSSTVFTTISYSLITMSNANSSDSDATVSYGSDSDFDGFTIEEIGRTSGATAAVGKATASTSGTRPRRVNVQDDSDSDSDTDEYYAELSSSSSDEVWFYSCICVI